MIRCAAAYSIIVEAEHEVVWYVTSHVVAVVLDVPLVVIRCSFRHLAVVIVPVAVVVVFVVVRCVSSG